MSLVSLPRSHGKLIKTLRASLCICFYISKLTHGRDKNRNHINVCVVFYFCVLKWVSVLEIPHTCVRLSDGLENTPDEDTKLSRKPPKNCGSARSDCAKCGRVKIICMVDAGGIVSQ